MPARISEAQPGRIFVGRLATGDDLVDEIERFCAEREVRAAWVSVIGAVRKSAFAYYDQAEQRYVPVSSASHYEITGFLGNISIRDGRPFLHAHATFCDVSGVATGGHLISGCEVFVAEVSIREMTGVELERTPDEVTGLALW